MSGKMRVEELDPPTQELLSGLFKGYNKFSRFGDAGYLLPATYRDGADDLRNMTVRPDDVWVATFPRSGTTWTQEMVWLLKNDLNYEMASKEVLQWRYKFVELAYVVQPKVLGQKETETESELLQQVAKNRPSLEEITKAPSPRFIKTHLPFSLLPPSLLDTTKVVYVARDPRDVAVSAYHFSRVVFNYTGDFKTYWNLFMNDLVIRAPFFPHLKEAWALRHHENLLFLFYEDMTRDLASSVSRVAKFLGKEITSKQLEELCRHLDIDNFRNNKSVNIPRWANNVTVPNAEPFIRKGKSGGWQEQFDAEMAAQAHAWLCENLAGTGLSFPHHTKQ